MTQELADKLILHYENTISEIELCDNNIDITNILRDTKTQLGICFCSESFFHTPVWEDNWIRSKVRKINNIQYGFYFYSTPNDFDDKKIILDCLQKRVDILKTFKEN